MNRLSSVGIVTGLLGLHLALLINLRFEAWPEMLIYPYLLKNGFLLYQDIINPYVPLFTGFLYGVFSLIPLNLQNLKLLTWVIILVSDLLIFHIARKRYDHTPAVIALFFFILVQPLLDGNGLWFDLALVPILLLAFDTASPWLLALAFFVKQSVLWLLPLFLRQWRKLLSALALLFIATATFFMFQGTLNDYLFWAWKFPFTIFPNMPGYKDFGSPRLWLVVVSVFALPLISFLLTQPINKKTISKRQPILWMLMSLMFIIPRFGFFHLQVALAFAALSLAQASAKIASVSRLKKAVISLASLGCIGLLGFLWQRHLGLYLNQPTRFFEPAILQAAETLKDQTPPDQPILFLNAPDQLMVLAKRIPTKPWAITFPWYLEVPGLQKRFIAAAKDHQVTHVVFSDYQNQGKFTPGSYVPQELNAYIQAEFYSVTILADTINLFIKR